MNLVYTAATTFPIRQFIQAQAVTGVFVKLKEIQMELPNIGDRVHIGDDPELYVVVDVDPETETVSLLPEDQVETRPLEDLVPIDGPAANN